MTSPQLDFRPDGTVRFLALTGLMGGRWYALHDVDQSDGRIRRLALGSPEATHRVFVQADSGRWTVALTHGEGRELEIPALERQMQAANYFMPNAKARDGR